VDNIHSQQAHENQNHKEKPLHIHWVGHNKKKWKIISVGKDVGTFIHCWHECKMVQLL